MISFLETRVTYCLLITGHSIVDTFNISQSKIHQAEFSDNANFEYR